MKQFAGMIVTTFLLSSVVASAHADAFQGGVLAPDLQSPLQREQPVVPLLSLSLGAAAQTTNGFSVDVTAVLNTWTVNDFYEPAFTTHRLDFSLQPGQKDGVVLQRLELKEASSPQAVLDKMLVDGALTLNMVW